MMSMVITIVEHLLYARHAPFSHLILKTLLTAITISSILMQAQHTVGYLINIC